MNLINLLVSEKVWWGLPKKLEFLKGIVTAIENTLWPILVVVATVGSIYAIYLGIQMAKAEDASKREESKKRVINAVIAMGVTVVLIVIIQTVLIPNIPLWVSNINSEKIASISAYTDGSGPYDTRSEVDGLLGSPYSKSENGLECVYRYKSGGENFEITITYNENNQVASVGSPTSH